MAGTERTREVRLGEVRKTQSGGFEILMGVDERGEDWYPWASAYVDMTMLPRAEDSVSHGLLQEGWIAPGEDLEPHVCGRKGKIRAGLRCLLRKGHDGQHRDGDFWWDEGY